MIDPGIIFPEASSIRGNIFKAVTSPADAGEINGDASSPVDVAAAGTGDTAGGYGCIGGG
jgi:hypothetical protein